MPYRYLPFINGGIYHVYNRGLGKQQIFFTPRDYSRFLKTLFYYQLDNPKPKFSLFSLSKSPSIDTSKKIIEILCYCLMPNHFHLLIRQARDGGVVEFMRRFIHSYVNYHNIKHNKQGPLFQGIFKAVPIETDEQLIHVSRYIHLNPYTSFLVKDLSQYKWSSYNAYAGEVEDKYLSKDMILNNFKSIDEYLKFISEHSDYAQTLEVLKHISKEYEKIA